MKIVIRVLGIGLALASVVSVWGDLNTALKNFSASLARLERVGREQLGRTPQGVREAEAREQQKREQERKRRKAEKNKKKRERRKQRKQEEARRQQKQQLPSSQQQRQPSSQQQRQRQPQQLPSEQELRTIEQKTHGFINLVRKAFKLKQLAWQPKLQQAAVNHSKDMAARKYFEHDSPEGHNFAYRYKQVGFDCSIKTGQSGNRTSFAGGGENIHESGPFTMIEWEGDQSEEEGMAETVTDWNKFKDMALENWQGNERPQIGTMLAACGLSSGDVAYMSFDVYDVLAFEIAHGWMTSPGHRKNILTPHWGQEGIGVAFGSEGILKATQNFC